ncbi:sugar transferase [Wandonia haliotis]|uniref:Sugar transferase n=1 Tax=Wandonia haliotis TaxID=574963 RepID=A0ABP3Y0N7_9FLAO
MKRCFDIVVSLIILSVFLPFGILIALAIKLDSKGTIFYRQERVGKNGKVFRLLKFRTMRTDADKAGKLTVGMRDPRITRIGYFLRKTKLDEFTQFWNVLIGDMSIVGPRPEVQEYVNLYTPQQREILTVRPGITDYASLEYFHENEILGAAENPRETYIHEVMPAKLDLNKKYLQNPTLLHDLKLMWMTFVKVLKG